jgi:ubiquitin C-terminal hydrolase
MQLYRLPQVLVLHLVRFAYGAGSSGKVNKAIAFSSSLRLKPNMLSEDCPDKKGAAQYRLVATVSHHGRTLSGERARAAAIAAAV